MLTSSPQRDDVARSRALGIAAYLTKPVKQSELLGAIVNVFSHASNLRPRFPRQVAYKIHRARRPLRILLAEDNPVNQDLALELLKKRGHSTVVVDNGQQALAALQRERFDAVLMDVQMPKMSGIEATRAIREKEKAVGAHVPIIAMTAHAMKGDRDRCLEAGMDAYVSKPIEAAELFRAVEGLVSSLPHREEATTQENSGVSLLDQAALLARFGGEAKLLRKLAGVFREDCPKKMSEIRKAIAAGDADTLAGAAHSLKGAGGNFGAKEVVQTARHLEAMGREGDLSRAGEVFKQLERGMQSLVEALRGVRGGRERGAANRSNSESQAGSDKHERVEG